MLVQFTVYSERRRVSMNGYGFCLGEEKLFDYTVHCTIYYEEVK